MTPSNKKHAVVLTGAGISAESGLKTFRDADGLWEGYDVMEVASPEGWQKNREMVLDFYNLRRAKVREANPNLAHLALAQLEERYHVTIITQNIDDLHERAGSTDIIHLHGEVLKARSTLDPSLVYTVKGDILPGDTCEKGSQLRPHIVWFGEPVPMISAAANVCQTADLLLIIGTSLLVYPAAGLVHAVDQTIPKYLVDPKIPDMGSISNLETIEANACKGVPALVEKLLLQG